METALGWKWLKLMEEMSRGEEGGTQPLLRSLHWSTSFFFFFSPGQFSDNLPFRGRFWLALEGYEQPCALAVNATEMQRSRLPWCELREHLGACSRRSRVGM